jgi:hypothetical protein
MKIPKVKRPSEEVLTKVHSLKGKKGMLAMIEPETGEWFLGKTALEALKKAKKKYPDRVFYCVRIGSPYAHEHKVFLLCSFPNSEREGFVRIFKLSIFQ